MRLADFDVTHQRHKIGSGGRVRARAGAPEARISSVLFSSNAHMKHFSAVGTRRTAVDADAILA